MVIVKIPATTANLGPGFDCLGLALNLYNYVSLEKSKEFKIEIMGEGREDISKDQGNIVYQCIQAVVKKAYEKKGFQERRNKRKEYQKNIFKKEDFKTLHITLTNNIPPARGLGSSSSALVGGALGANYLLGSPLSHGELLKIMTEIEGHPDNILPALFGGLLVSTQLEDGEILWSKTKVNPQWRYVVVIPDFQLTTDKSRSALPKNIPFKDAAFNLGRISLVMEGFLKEDISLLGKVMDDRIHEPYRRELVPGLKEILKTLRRERYPVALSGAGPTVMAIVESEEEGEGLGKRMQEIFLQYEVTSSVKVLSPNNNGAEVLSSTAIEPLIKK
ncbi:homoserine kinase [Isachenkonia alkalipeptolytica]|uniref:Homoserine kinase n=1 Tax=Isachenkonia alkalipeptolytica TaxID=2565777 RepID=A0AA44BEW3_9CLOT|nr:homoserine kinase [Isachenkonia alkalipeptolytica]NBG87956.1 homoserine kinase [Isachenkonia alkalipeptolytica]